MYRSIGNQFRVECSFTLLKCCFICQVNGNGGDGLESTALYKVGDKVDGKDLKMGAWFEAQIKEVLKSGGVSNGGPTPSNNDSRPKYQIVFDE